MDKKLKKELNELMLNIVMCPIHLDDTPKEILVIDIDYLPSEFKGGDISELQEDLEKKYKRNILLIDTSRKNLQGNSSTNNPIYTI